MATIREQILEQITATLEGVVAGKSAYRSRVNPFAKEEAPAIAVAGGTDTAEFGTIPTVDWTLQVQAAVYVRGRVPDRLADPYVNEVYRRLMADRTQGGLAFDTFPASIEPQMEGADSDAGWVVLTFAVRYRTKNEDLSQS